MNDYSSFIDHLYPVATLTDELITEGFFTDGYYNRAAFWQEVKQEIERL